MSDEVKAAYDISQKVLPYLDPHMAVVILTFLAEKKLYNETTLASSKAALLATYKKDSSSLTAAKEAVGVFGDLTTDDAVNTFRGASELDTEFVMSNGATEENIVAIPHYAKCLYDAGHYAQSRTLLGVFRSVSNDEDALALALWGRLAASIISNDMEAVEDARILRESIDTRVRPYGEQTLQRAWFLHWSLFLAFSFPAARNLLLDAISHGNSSAVQSDRLLSIVQGDCQHLFRYLSVLAVITSSSTFHQASKRGSHGNIRDLVRIISSEDITYVDPVVEFVRALLIDFDFPKAASSLNQCRSLFASDFFLSSKTTQKDFFEAARQLFVSTYSRVNSEADVTNLITQFGIVGYDEVSVASSHNAVSHSNKAGSNFAPASAHAQIRDRARNIVYRSNNILDKDGKKSM